MKTAVYIHTTHKFMHTQYKQSAVCVEEYQTYTMEEVVNKTHMRDLHK